MKNKRVITMAVAFIAIMAVAGLVTATYASGGSGEGGRFHNKPFINEEKREEMKANYEATREAIANNDYEAWQELMADKPMAEEMTEEKFAKLVEMHNLMQAGDREGAEAIREELGFPMGPKGFEHKMEGRKFEMKDNNGDGVCNQLDIDDSSEK